MKIELTPLKTLKQSDKAWQLNPNEIIRERDYVEIKRGKFLYLAHCSSEQYTWMVNQLVKHLPRVGFIFKARVFRTGMIGR